MRLAFLVTPEQPVPPPNYGGAERAVDIWVRGLMARKHDVDLYCAPGSTCPATNLISPPSPGMAHEGTLARMVAVGDYDCVVDYSANHIAGQMMKSKVVSIMGGDPFFRYPHDRVHNRVYGSRAFAEYNGCFDARTIVYPVEENFESIRQVSHNGPPLYVGTIHRMKGVRDAAKACNVCGTRLQLYGPIRDESYFETFRSEVDYHGMLGRDGRSDVFGSACCFVHPVKVCDCNPMAPREAMLRGTPIVAYPNGGIVESARKTGVFCEDFSSLANAIDVFWGGETPDEDLVQTHIAVRAEAEEYNDVERSVDEIENLCLAAAREFTW